MDSFAGIFERFISRDLYYLIGGTSVIACLLLCFFPQIILRDSNSFLTAILILFSYAVGYLVFEMFSFLRIAKTILPNDRLSSFDRTLFSHHTGRKAPDLAKFRGKNMNSLSVKVKNELKKAHDDEELFQLKRIINLKQLAGTLFANLCICEFIILTKIISSCQCCQLSQELIIIAGLVFILAITSLVINRIRINGLCRF